MLNAMLQREFGEKLQIYTTFKILQRELHEKSCVGFREGAEGSYVKQKK